MQVSHHHRLAGLLTTAADSLQCCMAGCSFLGSFRSDVTIHDGHLSTLWVSMMKCETQLTLTRTPNRAETWICNVIWHRCRTCAGFVQNRFSCRARRKATTMKTMATAIRTGGTSVQAESLQETVTGLAIDMLCVDLRAAWPYHFPWCLFLPRHICIVWSLRPMVFFFRPKGGYPAQHSRLGHWHA